MAQAAVTLPPFKKPKDASDCLVALEKYVKRARLAFDILKIEDEVADQKARKAYLGLWGGEDIEDLITNTADPPVEPNTSFDNMIKAINLSLIHI